MTRRQVIRLERPALSLRVDPRAIAVTAALALVAFAALVVSVGVGELAIAPPDVVRALLGRGERRHEFVITELRLPRALVAFLVGTALAVSGAILQGLTRNPLAAPELIGVTAGANVAAVIVIVALPQTPIAFLSVAAFAGALAATALVYALAWRGGGSPMRVVLVGIGLTAAGYAVVTAVISSVDEIVHASQLVVFTAGSVYGKGWKELATLGPAVLVLGALAVGGARHLDALRLGDEMASGLGVHVARRRLSLLALAAALAAAAVATAGPVSFVGLMAPHIARRLVGAAHIAVVPVAAMLGGTIVIVADALARTSFAPVDIPVGVMTAVVGAPYFVYLLYRTGL
ncbi:MAG: FecCD family ABC transporter permease [Solirubrobacteraceae bacterium]